MVEPFDWTDYLSLAEVLGNRPDQASARTAISRAYYYVYHLALRRAVDNNFILVRGEAAHAQLWRLFDGSPEPACQRLGQIARRLRMSRQRADYERHFPRIEEELPLMLTDARDFAAQLGRLPTRLPSPRSVRH